MCNKHKFDKKREGWDEQCLGGEVGTQFYIWFNLYSCQTGGNRHDRKSRFLWVLQRFNFLSGWAPIWSLFRMFFFERSVNTLSLWLKIQSHLCVCVHDRKRWVINWPIMSHPHPSASLPVTQAAAASPTHLLLIPFSPSSQSYHSSLAPFPSFCHLALVQPLITCS